MWTFHQNLSHRTKKSRVQSGHQKIKNSLIYRIPSTLHFRVTRKHNVGPFGSRRTLFFHAWYTTIVYALDNITTWLNIIWHLCSTHLLFPISIMTMLELECWRASSSHVVKWLKVSRLHKQCHDAILNHNTAPNITHIQNYVKLWAAEN